MPSATLLQGIGAIMSGIGLIIAAITGMTALFIFNRRQVQDAWVDRFRSLYAEFWKDDTMSEVRKWVLNDNIFAEKAPVFERRNAMQKCNVSRDDHDVLESFDRFCSILLRSRSFIGPRMNKRQRRLWIKLFGGDFWVKKIAERPELQEYVSKHWNELVA